MSVELERSELTEKLSAAEETLTSVRQQLNDAQSEVSLLFVFCLLLLLVLLLVLELLLLLST